MPTFSAVRTHLATLETDTDRLLKEINKLEETHECNRISIFQCEKDFVQAKAAEDGLQAELDKAWKKTDSVKNKQRKLNRKQMEVQSEQAKKWQQFTVKMAIVNELRSLCGDPFAIPPVTTKRASPADGFAQYGVSKKAKGFTSASCIDVDNDAKCVIFAKDASANKKGINSLRKVITMEKGDKVKPEMKEEKKLKVDEDLFLGSTN